MLICRRLLTQSNNRLRRTRLSAALFGAEATVVLESKDLHCSALNPEQGGATTRVSTLLRSQHNRRNDMND
jgi:hypothetical protein